MHTIFFFKKGLKFYSELIWQTVLIELPNITKSKIDVTTHVPETVLKKMVRATVAITPKKVKAITVVTAYTSVTGTERSAVFSVNNK